MLSSTHTFLAETAARALPRILTQICRDPDAPSYGACDRNWWHYKIRDFSSIILQQAGYALAIASESPWLERLAPVRLGSVPLPTTETPNHQNTALRSLAAATARFWNQRALRHGAFEEYYPYEKGYPPVAFATLAVAKLCHMGVVPTDDIRPGLAIAAKQLLTRFEAQAANQQIAGTAALSVIRTIAPDLIEEKTFHDILTRILDLQHLEGWFPEYDGPDLGYLAVSIDCLYDIHDHTADPRILPAIRKAAEFISWFALSPLGGAGMHNSRNTDYITPYGLVRLALEENDPAIVATVAAVFNRHSPQQDSGRKSEDAERRSESQPQSPISNLQSPFHFFDAIDDRYWCHYIGHSVFRALLLLENRGCDLHYQSIAGTSCPQPPSLDSPNLPILPDGHRPPQATLPLPPVSCPLSPEKCRPGSGHALLTSLAGATALVSTRKGSIATAIWPDGAVANDFGWIVQTPDKLLVTHWWSTDWQVESTDTHATTKGWLVSHKEHLSTPWKHILLRIASFILGRRLIKILKRLVIFKKPLQSHHFTRTVTWQDDTLVITDIIEGLSPSDQVTRAPRTSKRHVASADSFHPQDLAMFEECRRAETIERTDSVFQCESRYGRKEMGHQKTEIGI